MNNILTAITSIVEHRSQIRDIKGGDSIQNRANQMGDALEDFVKNAFADCLGIEDKDKINHLRSKTFSYLGNNTNPPDAIIQGGDAIEIKKLASLRTKYLQLNSSYPKNKLLSSNPKLCRACVECEDWGVKDMLYVVGQVDKKSIRNLFFVYGDLYCDSYEIYENVENAIKDGLKTLNDVDLADTQELGRVNKVDHLEISCLRIRGMWLIESPFLVFKSLIPKDEDYKFRMIALIPKSKYDSLSGKEKFESFCKLNGINIIDFDIPNPQNPCKLIKSKLITYCI